jgi:hypothetical protein
MGSHDKEPKCGTIKSFLGSCSVEEKKGHISTSVIDESLTENLFIPSEISCSSKEPPLSP